MHTHTLPQGLLRQQSWCPSPSGTVWLWDQRLSSCFPPSTGPSTGPVSGLWCGLEQGPGFPGKWRHRVTVTHPMLYCVQVTGPRECGPRRGGELSSSPFPLVSDLPATRWVGGMGPWEGWNRVRELLQTQLRPPHQCQRAGLTAPPHRPLSPSPAPTIPIILCHVG